MRARTILSICMVVIILAVSTICGFGNNEVIVSHDYRDKNKIVGGAVVTGKGIAEISAEEVKKILQHDEVELNCSKGFKTRILSAKKEMNLPVIVYANPIYNGTANPIKRQIIGSINQEYETDAADPNDVVKVFNSFSKTSIGLHFQGKYSLSVNVEPGKTLSVKYKPYFYQIKGKQLIYAGHGVYMWKEFSGRFPHISGADELYGLFIYEEVRNE